MFGPVSGGHFNPVVSFVDAAFGGLRWGDAAAYLPAQVAGASAAPWWPTSCSPWPQFPSRPSTGLRAPISFPKWWPPSGCCWSSSPWPAPVGAGWPPAAVGAYIGAAYFFTSSTSFANPAITVGRMFSDTFAGIAPSSAPSFIGAQVVGGIVAIGAIKVLYPNITPEEAAEVVVPHRSLDGAGQQGTAAPTKVPSEPEPPQP